MYYVTRSVVKMPKLLVFYLVCLLFIDVSFGADKYIVNTSQCKIPDLIPYNDEVKGIMQPASYYSCNSTELLSYVTKNGDTAELHIKEELIPLYTSKNISCCVSYVTRNGTADEPDVGISFSDCKPFDKDVILEQDTVKVICTETDTSNTVYENVHNPITRKALKNKLNTFKDGPKPFSVLFVVVDSVSRLNCMRTMNETYKFLVDNGFVDMKGYTKVGDNTFPNFMAFLTGYNLDQANHICNPTVLGKLDTCPMMWYDYRDQGYITAYAEDDTPITTFNYEKKGFIVPPTDYYLKSYVEATETMKIVDRYTMPYCTGPETAGERILNLAKDFAVTYLNESTFGIFWANTYSHNDINAPYGMDEKIRDFFSDIKNAGVLDESFVIFMADHGIRFGPIRKTRSGWLEERMPMNLISVPKRFKEEFKEEYQNLKDNANKLTNTYDLFMTLQHILTLSGLPYDVRESIACPKCQSMFEKIPDLRTCEDASIDTEWCTCPGYLTPMDTSDEIVKNATLLAFEKAKITIYNETKCTNITETHVVSAAVSETLEQFGDAKNLFIVFKIKGTQTAVLTTVRFDKVVDENSFVFIQFFKLDTCDALNPESHFIEIK